MYFLLLFVGFFSFLTLIALSDPSRRLAFIPAAAFLGRRAGQHAHGAVRATGIFAAERKEERPCVTAADCVQSGQCAGHCGWR